MTFRNQIVGIIRFSHPSTGGYKKTPTSGPASEAYVYDDARLERRFRLFESICVPCLAAQTDTDFRVVIVTGDKMPDTFQDRLLSAAEAIPNALVVPVHPGHSYWAINRGLAKVPKEDATHRTTFRMDDDDGVDNAYIERLKRLAHWMHDPDRPERDFVIAHNKGLYFEMKEGGNQVFDVCERIPLGIALSLTAPISHRQNVYHTNHRSLGAFHDIYMDATTPAFIRSVHSDNDSSLNVNGVRDQLSKDQVKTVMDQNFALSYDTALDL